ncbi:MAG: hypothetical protein IJS10_01670 [Alphaproteobacteria bacterium]|nr:hypothetical protein [Alphaproteobacteria bacterium]
MKKIGLVTSAIVCVCVNQKIVAESLTINAEDLLNDKYKNYIAISDMEYEYFKDPNYRYIGISDASHERYKKLECYHRTKKFSNYANIEWGTTDANEIILEKLLQVKGNGGRPVFPEDQIEVELRIPAEIDGK